MTDRPHVIIANHKATGTELLVVGKKEPDGHRPGEVRIGLSLMTRPEVTDNAIRFHVNREPFILPTVNNILGEAYETCVVALVNTRNRLIKRALRARI